MCRKLLTYTHMSHVSYMSCVVSPICHESCLMTYRRHHSGHVSKTSHLHKYTHTTNIPHHGVHAWGDSLGAFATNFKYASIDSYTRHESYIRDVTYPTMAYTPGVMHWVLLRQSSKMPPSPKDVWSSWSARPLCIV